MIMDAQSALNFLVPQLVRIETEVYRMQYPDLNWSGLIPVDTSGPAWIKAITFFSQDMVGQAKFVSGQADDIPLADITRASGTETVHMAGIGYEYNLEEIQTAALIPGMNLTNEKAAAARLAHEMFMWDLALNGNSEKGMTGLFNNASVTAGYFAADGTGSSRLWSTKTPAQIVRDINSLLSPIYTASNYIELADTLLLPYDALLYLAQTPYSDNTMETILSFVQKTNVYTLQTGQPLTIKSIRGAENYGASSTGRVVAYRNSPDVLKLHMPLPFQFLPVFQQAPMRWVVPGIFRTGGVEIRRPGAVRYGDGAVA